MGVVIGGVIWGGCGQVDVMGVDSWKLLFQLEESDIGGCGLVGVVW